MELTVTLNRAHKIVERLKQKRNSIRLRFANSIKPVTISLVSGMIGLPVNADEGDLESTTLFEQIHNLSVEIAEVRKEIQKANARIGIDALLVEHSEIIATRNCLVPVLARENLYEEESGVSSQEATNILRRLSSTTESASTSTRVCLLRITPETKQKFLEVSEEYTARANALMDEISDLNKEKITINISDENKQIAGIFDD